MLALPHSDVTFENVAGGQVTAAARGREEFRALADIALPRDTRRIAACAREITRCAQHAG